MPLSKRNRRGLLVVLILGLIISYTPRIIAANSPDNVPEITFEEIEKVEKEIKLKKNIRAKGKRKVWKSKYNAAQQSFDPNEYQLKDWMALGLSEKQANVVIKFSAHGLKSNEDLKKIFVIPDELFNLIKDSTFYPELITVQKEDFEPEKIELSISLNVADELELKTLPGIGDYFASKIVEYRTELGGFTSFNQLLEIWNFGEERFEKINSSIYLDLENLVQIDINTATFDELAIHPYISYKVANSIVKMRAAHGNYTSVDGILESKLINQELFLKIKMYLKV